MMRVQFWGTRGSIARAVPETNRFGGNTSCVEVRSDAGALAVLDCGTGAYDLGRALLAAGGPSRGHLFITHTHWDHIQGFPFFAPLFVPGAEWDIYAPGGLGQKLEATLAGQMEYAYFPIALGQLGATIRFHDLGEGSFQVDGLRVTAKYLNHPALTLGYRLEVGGASVVYAVDHEPHSWQPEDGAGPAARFGHHEEDRHIEFLHGAGLVIHDAQYTDAEYPARTGWGHSTMEYAVDAAVTANALRLALFHHDPARTDDALLEVLQVARARAASQGSLEVLAAAQRQTVDLDEVTVGPVSTPARPASPPAAGGEPKPAPTLRVLIADDDPEILRLLLMTLRPEGFELLTAADGSEALAVARAEAPDLVLLDRQMPGLTGLEVCRALRASPDPALRDVPVVLLTAIGGAEATQEGFAAGVTDYLVKPFAPAHVRTRVRTWLLRKA